MADKVSIDDTVLAVAAQITDRAHELISDGWDDYHFEFSKWADLDSDQMEAAKQYMHAVIA